MMWKALYKKEISGFFYSRSAYFIFAIFLVLSMACAAFFGLYLVSENLSMSSYFAYLPQILIIVIPAITIRLWSEEAKNGTLELLRTYPFSDFCLTTAKFSAAWSLVFIMLGLSLPLVFTTAYWLEVDSLNIFSAYLGTFLLATALTALGCVVSACFSIPIVAYLVSVVLGWIMIGFDFQLPNIVYYLLPDAPFYIQETFNSGARYTHFINGNFSIDDIFYFVFLTIILLIFNGIYIIHQQRKFFKTLTVAVLLLSSFAVTLFACSWWLGRYPIDMTSRKIYTLSENSQQYAKNLQQSVDFTLYISDNLDDYDLGLNKYASDVIALLSRYNLESSYKIRLEVRHIKPFSHMEAQAKKDGLTPLLTDEQDYFFGMKATFADGRTQTVPLFEPQRSYLLQNDINHILNMANHRTKPVIGVLSLQMPLFDKSEKIQNHKIIEFLSAFYNIINIPEKASYIPLDIEVLLVYNPVELDWTLGYALDQYVMQGGKVIFFVDPYSEILHKLRGYPPRPDIQMQEFLKHWGVDYNPNFVRADKKNGIKTEDEHGKYLRYPLWFFAHGENTDKIHLKTVGSLKPNHDKLQYKTLISAQNQGGFIKTADVRYTPKSKIIDYYQEDKEISIFALSVQGEFLSHYGEDITKFSSPDIMAFPYRPISKPEAQIVVIADSDILSDNSWIEQYNPQNPFYGTIAYADNADYILNLINSLINHTELSPYLPNKKADNLAEVFYLKFFDKYAEKYFNLTDEISALSYKYNSLKRQGVDFDDIKLRAEISHLSDKIQDKKNKLKMLENLIKHKCSQYLYLFLILNIIIFPVAFICGIMLIVALVRHRSRFVAGEKL